MFAVLRARFKKAFDPIAVHASYSYDFLAVAQINTITLRDNHPPSGNKMVYEKQEVGDPHMNDRSSGLIDLLDKKIEPRRISYDSTRVAPPRMPRLRHIHALELPAGLGFAAIFCLICCISA